MTRKTHNLVVANGTKTGKDGKPCTNWETIGGLFEREDGRQFITLRRTFNPAGVAVNDDGSNREAIFVNLFDSKKGD